MTAIMKFIYDDPISVIVLLIGIGGLLFLCIEIFPKMLRGREKHDLEALNKTTSHELAKAPGVIEYFDTSFPVTAIETTQDFVSLENGWKYAEKQEYDFKTAKPDAEEVMIDENSTEFEKQGFDRRMMRDSE